MANLSGSIWPLPLPQPKRPWWHRLLFVKPRWGWALVGEYRRELGKPGSGHWLIVADGFTTDLVTRPTNRLIAWLVDANDPQTARAAIVHDALLAQDFEQRVAAGEFYRVLAEDGVPLWKAKLFYAAVLLASDNWANAGVLSVAH